MNNAYRMKMKIWVRISFLTVLLILFVFIEIFAYAYNMGFHVSPTTTGITIYWGMAIAINLIIAYLFLTITGGSEKNDGMVALYLTAGLVLLIIFMLLGTPLHIWSGPAFP